MRAVAVSPRQRGSLHVRDNVPEPEPGPGDARVRVLEAGVCGTDAEIAEGHFGDAPEGRDYLVLGHESLGVVESAPPGARVQPGELVVPTVRRPCPEPCLPCSTGRSDFCLTGRYRERGITGLHGFMSERYVESPDFLVAVPAALRAVAVLVEPWSVVEKGLDQALLAQERLPWAPHRAVVTGAGTVGISAAAALRLRGLEVTVASREPEGSFKPRLLADAGIAFASTAGTSLEDPAIQARLAGADLVFEATGAAEVVPPAVQLLGPNGVAVLSSVTSGEHRQPCDVAAWNRRMVMGNRLVLGTVNAGRRHFEAAVRDLALADVRLPGWLARLLTRRLPFPDAARALERSPDGIKTVLEFD
jgi:threonine dehydrogenase-like Zn-dependent dehydrogenase